MNAILIGGMVAGAVIEGAQQSGKVSSIEDQIAALKLTNTQLARSYQSIETAIGTDLDELKQTVVTLQQKRQDVASQLSAYRNTYDDTQRRIMYVGIAFVSYVFFALLLKLFLPKGGIFGAVKDAIS